MQPDAIDSSNADVTGDDFLDLLQLAMQRVISLEDLLAIIVEHFPLGGEAKVFLAALDQQRFELALE